MNLDILTQKKRKKALHRITVEGWLKVLDPPLLNKPPLFKIFNVVHWVYLEIWFNRITTAKESTQLRTITVFRMENVGLVFPRPLFRFLSLTDVKFPTIVANQDINHIRRIAVEIPSVFPVELTELELSTWTEISSVMVDARFLADEQTNLLGWSLGWRRSKLRTN